MTLAYWSILATAFLPIGCAAYAKRLAGFSWADNQDPRAFLARTRGKAARANAAQQNSYEIFPPFAAAVIIAHATGEAAQSTVNILSALFLLLRAAYIWAYAQDKAALRSNIWYGCLMCIVALFIAAC